MFVGVPDVALNRVLVLRAEEEGVDRGPRRRGDHGGADVHDPVANADRVQPLPAVLAHVRPDAVVGRVAERRRGEAVEVGEGLAGPRAALLHSLELAGSDAVQAGARDEEGVGDAARRRAAAEHDEAVVVALRRGGVGARGDLDVD